MPDCKPLSLSCDNRWEADRRPLNRGIRQVFPGGLGKYYNGFNIPLWYSLWVTAKRLGGRRA